MKVAKDYTISETEIEIVKKYSASFRETYKKK